MKRKRLSFGPFRLDRTERRLWSGTDVVSLAPKPFDVLLHLAERPGRLITKNELLRAVWPGVHVGEAVLKTCIAEIRRALHDDAASPRCVETVARQGYRFIAPIQSNNVPDRATRFVGRRREIDEVKFLLGKSRLVTLLGAAGVGKSSLAGQIASDLVYSVPHGACWVDLAPLFEPEQIALTVATELGIGDYAGGAIVDTVLEFLEGRELLLILDNCEHLIDACASFVDQLLRVCSGTKVFATSREPLCVDREIAWRVPPLSLPDASDSIDSLLSSEAVQLFVDRASTSSPSFRLTAQNAQSVIDICRRLDGVPLAVEIAAARVSILTPDEIAARLDDALALLDNDGRTRRAHRQTLSKALEWSYDTLSAKERLALSAFTVFAGDFSLAAAESVCDGTTEIHRSEVLTLLSRLVDKSMVVLVNRPGVPETRFKLLQIMGQFAQKQTPSRLSAILPSLHAQFFARLCEDLSPIMNTGRREEAFAELQREYSNVRAALEWSRSDTSDLHVGLRIAGAIWPYWVRRGHIREGLNWLQRLLKHDQNAPSECKASALIGAGALVQMDGNYTLALAYLSESIRLHRDDNNLSELGIALYQFSRVAYRNGEMSESGIALQESIELLRRWTPGWFLALALSEKGIREMYDGHLKEAAALQEESAAIMRYNDDVFGLTVPLRNLALLATYQRQYDRALAYCREALEILCSIDDHHMVSYTLEVIATARCLNGDYADAARLLGAAERQRRSAGLAWPKNRRNDYDRMLDTLRSHLSAADFNTSWASGRALSREDAIAAAMVSDSAE